LYYLNSYIEVFKSNYSDARASITNDTQTLVHQNNEYSTEWQENHARNDRNTHIDNNYNTKTNSHKNITTPYDCFSYAENIEHDSCKRKL
jgi:hypothetical protein